MVRIIAGLSVFVLVLSGVFWPGQTAVPLAAPQVISPTPPLTLTDASIRVVESLNAVAREDDAVSRNATDLAREKMDANVHLVTRGESLYSIALKHYATTRAHGAILNANRDRIGDPARLEAGTVLRLPDYDG